MRIVMDTGTIKLGAIQRLSRKPRPSVLLEGFFYVERTGLLEQPARGSVLASRVQEKEHSRKCQTPLAILSCSYEAYSRPQEHTLYAPDFTDNICRQQRYVETTELTELYGKWLRAVNPLPAPFYNSYDIPSRKRVARYTNNLHTGAMPTVMGEGQRLRKGCWRIWRRDTVGLSCASYFFGMKKLIQTLFAKKYDGVNRVLEAAVRIAGRKSRLHCKSNCCGQGQARQRGRCIGGHLYLFSNNLSSAAEIRYSARNTTLRSKNLCVACTHS